MSTKLQSGIAAPFPVPLEQDSLVERGLAAIALAALSPALVVIGAAVAVASHRSPLVAHRRVGYLGRPLWMLKFRTMWGNDDATGGSTLIERLPEIFVPTDKRAVDPRVSHPLGRMLRRMSLDELPQLIHIVRGEMSFIGPRPITEEELATHYGTAARTVLAVKPGITGLWQVMGRDRLTYRERRRLDLFWVRHACPKLAMWIAARTVVAVLSGADAH